MTPKQVAAMEELQSKTLATIQAETAITWAYRAWAAKQLGKTMDAWEYEHEALEHAALSDPRMLDLVREIMGAA